MDLDSINIQHSILYHNLGLNGGLKISHVLCRFRILSIPCSPMVSYQP